MLLGCARREATGTTGKATLARGWLVERELNAQALQLLGLRRGRHEQAVVVRKPKDDEYPESCGDDGVESCQRSTAGSSVQGLCSSGRLSCRSFLLPSAVASKQVKSSVLLLFGHSLRAAGSGPCWHRHLLSHTVCFLVQRALWVSQSLGGTFHKVTVVVSELPLHYGGFAGDLGVQGGRLVWEGCSGSWVPRSSEGHPHGPACAWVRNWGWDGSTWAGETQQTAWVPCCPRASEDLLAPLVSSAPKPRLESRPEPPLLGFPTVLLLWGKQPRPFMLPADEGEEEVM